MCNTEPWDSSHSRNRTALLKQICSMLKLSCFPRQRLAYRAASVRTPSSAPECVRPTFILTLFSNVWLILGKLWEARSRLYRRQSLQVRTRLISFDSS